MHAISVLEQHSGGGPGVQFHQHANRFDEIVQINPKGIYPDFALNDTGACVHERSTTKEHNEGRKERERREREGGVTVNTESQTKRAHGHAHVISVQGCTDPQPIMMTSIAHRS